MDGKLVVMVGPDLRLAMIPSVILRLSQKDKTMRLQYYPDTNSAYIEVSGSPGVKTIEVADSVNINLGVHGELVGIELERASKHLDSPMLSKVEKEGLLMGSR